MTKILRMHQFPQSEQLPDRSWRAWYVGLDLSVNAPTREAAETALREEFQRRSADPELHRQLAELAQSNLLDPSPPAGIITEMITQEQYQARIASALDEPGGEIIR
ncbi:hypothetical protein [Nocardia sp. NPDC058666]|uniref:hypothetical protein n=1 Tax=Nocardia sp. NPDC058666 TaxID=3346587 RepID=UPI003653E2A3